MLEGEYLGANRSRLEHRRPGTTDAPSWWMTKNPGSNPPEQLTHDSGMRSTYAREHGEA